VRKRGSSEKPMKKEQRQWEREKEGRERERNTVRKKMKKSFIIDQRNRVLLPSPIAHSIQAVFDFPLKIRASPCLFVMQPRPAGTRYTMLYSTYTGWSKKTIKHFNWHNIRAIKKIHWHESANQHKNKAK